MERKALPEHFKDVFTQPRIIKNSQSNLNLKLNHAPGPPLATGLHTNNIVHIPDQFFDRLPLEFGKEIHKCIKVISDLRYLVLTYVEI